MHAELERDHLERTGVRPDRRREGDRLEIDEAGRRRVGRELSCGAFGIDIDPAGEGIALDAQVGVVQELVRHLAHVGGTRVEALPEHAAGDSRQPAHRIFRLRHAGAAVRLEATGVGEVAVLPRPDVRLGRLGRHSPGAGDPGRNLIVSPERLRAQVFFHQQAAIAAVPGGHPAAVDAGQRGAIERDAGGTRDEGMDGRIVAVIVLDPGGGLDFRSWCQSRQSV